MALFPMAQPVEVNRRSIEEARKKRTGPSLFPLKDRIEQIDFSGSPSADSVPGNMGITPMPSRRPSYGVNPPSSMGESFIPKGITPYSPSSIGQDIPSQPEQAENKPSLFGKLFGKKDSGSKKVDEYGLEVPETSKPGMLQKILGIGLPTLIGLAGGGGFGGLAGAATGYFGQKAGQRASEKEALDAYNQQRLAIEKARQPSAGQKDFEYFSGLSPEQQDAYLKMKSAGSMNPLALARFDYQREKDARKEEMDALGENVPASNAMTLAEGEALPQIMTDLKETIKQNQSAMGPIMGRLRSLNPYDTQAQTLQAKIEAAKQVVGKFMEGGVLRKEDVPKYEAILAGIKNDPKTAIDKINSVENDLRNKYDTYVKSLGRAGYNVSKFPTLSQSQNKQSSMARPSGAVGIAPGSDGKRYYHDAQGNILGEAS